MINRHRSGRGRNRTRRGSIYIIVLGTALIASVLALSALMVQRIQRNAGQEAPHVVKARLSADAALRIGMLRIQNDPDWRYSFSDGVWEADVTVGDGTYTLEGIDPSDGDLSDSPTDPLVLNGIGKKGNAVQETEITLAPENRALDCLEVGMLSAGNMTFDSATLNFNGTISSNDSVSETGSSSIGVNTDVEAVNTITGDDFAGSTTTGVDPREMPDSDTAFDWYVANGTPIDVNDIAPPPLPNLLSNPGAESGTTGWAAVDCTMESSASDPHGGAACLEMTDGGGSGSGLQQVVEGVENGATYDFEVWARKASGTSDVRITLVIDSSGEGEQSFYNDPTSVGGTWTKCTSALTPTWTGTLNEARVKFTPWSGTYDLLIDDAAMREAPPPPRTIYQAVLSPNSNPYGGSTTDPQGIYVIDCEGLDVHVQASRIVGTLVLLNPAAGSSIRDGPVNWAPAVQNFPALMVDGDFEINANNNGLNETAEGTNFNPIGTPHPDLAPAEDSDQDDTYPSEINGLIYVSGDLDVHNHPVIDGVVVADTIDVTDTVDLSYQPIHLANPPPGFSGPEEIKILLDSARKVPH